MYSSYLFAAIFFTIYIFMLSSPELHGFEKHTKATWLALLGAIIIAVPFYMIESVVSFSPVVFFTIILVLAMIVVVASMKEFLRKEKLEEVRKK